MYGIRRQTGFTLIELVMVIVILGILAAFALPRFADLSGDARRATIEGLAGTLKAAAAIAHSKQLVANAGSAASVTLEGQTVTMINGYPTADVNGIQVAANVDTNDFTVSAAGAAAAGSTMTFTVPGAVTPANCQVSYTSPSAANTNYEVVVDASGC